MVKRFARYPASRRPWRNKNARHPESSANGKAPDKLVRGAAGGNRWRDVIEEPVVLVVIENEEGLSPHIGRGTLIFIGVRKLDTHSEADYLAEKIANLRIFPDDAGKMNRSLLDIGGAALVVSQFTLYGDCSKGRRPGFDEAAPPELANELYEYLVTTLRASGISVETGVFQADMQVSLINDGPVTFVLDSRGNKSIANLP